MSSETPYPDHDREFPIQPTEDGKWVYIPPEDRALRREVVASLHGALGTGLEPDQDQDPGA